jgi:Heparinase II/III-like protein
MLECSALAPGGKRACGPLAAVLALAAALVPFPACAAPRAGGPPPPDVAHPLMIPPGRLPAMRAAAAKGAPAWRALKAVVDANYGKEGLGDAGVMNVAVVYLVTGEARYCERLAAEARRTMATANPRADSYYGYAGIMGALATELTHCEAVLDPTLRADIAAYLDTWTDELWFHNKGSGWGLDDPGNNYHVSFLLGTAWAGLALQAVGHPGAGKWLDLVARGVDRELAYLAERCAGGGWSEGTNYGEGAKGRLADLFSLLAAAGVRNAFQSSDWFPAALRYAHYQLQPDGAHLYPAGDMARESDMTANSYDRQYVQQMVYWLPDSEARAVGQWYLENVAPSYRTGFPHPTALWRDLVYAADVPARPQATLPLAYRARGDELVSIRSGWDADATALTVSGASRIDQSHAHLDTGGFTLWRNGWQLVDAVTYSHSGLLQEPGAHNLVHVAGARKVAVSPKGILRFEDEPRASYLQIDGTALYAARETRRPGNFLLRELKALVRDRNLLLEEFTRELVFLKPDVLVVYDRVRPAEPGTAFDWRLHFPAQPSLSGATLRSTNGKGGVTVALLLGDAPAVVPDGDLAPDGSKAWRAQATTQSGTFLAVARVASGGAPPLDASLVTTTGDMEGAAVGGDVVLFSKLPFGAAPRLGFSYTVPAVPGRVHTLVDMAGSVGVSFRREGADTVVTIGRGSDRTASVEGVVRFSEPPPR